jgi:hypothetical protein
MSTDKISINTELLMRRLAELEDTEPTLTLRDAGGGNGPHMPDMSERLGRLEGEVGGLKHGQNMMLGGLGLVAALVTIVVASVVGFGIYELQRIDQVGDRITTVNDKVNELPGKIGAELRDITKTLADVIIATKQVQPPTPVPPTPPTTPPPPK